MMTRSGEEPITADVAGLEHRLCYRVTKHFHSGLVELPNQIPFTHLGDGR